MKLVLAELRNMLPAELHREIQMKLHEAKKIRLGVTMGSEKNHAALRMLRRDIARMRMVEEEMRKGLKKSSPNATLPAPKTSQKKQTKVASRAPKKSSVSSVSSSSSS